MSALESFRFARWARTANLFLQAALFLSLFAGINYLAGTQGGREDPWRFDLTRYRRYTLSPETLAYLKDLPRPVRIVVTVDEDAAGADVRGLLREYAAVTEGRPDGRVNVEYLDVDLRRREAQQLGLDQAGQIVLMSGDNRRALSIDDLYRYEDQQRKDFQGERVITSAILDAASAGHKTICFLAGHEELRPDDVDPSRGLSTARERLRERNLEVDVLDLTSVRAIPSDASLLIAVQPKSPYTASEQEMLRQFLGASDGRLILFLAPGYRHGLDHLLHDWGVSVDDDFLHDTDPDEMTEDGDFIITSFAPSHPVTQALLHSSFRARLRVGPARSVRPDPEGAAANGLDVTTLAAASPTAWGEVDYRARGPAVFNAGVDIRASARSHPPGRLGIAAASERVAARDNLPFSVRTGRLVVFGTGDLIDNARIANEGVLNFFLGAVNWTLDSDNQLNIPARPIERFQLSLSAREHEDLRYCLMFFLPGAAALLGLIVYWPRRS